MPQVLRSGVQPVNVSIFRPKNLDLWGLIHHPHHHLLFLVLTFPNTSPRAGSSFLYVFLTHLYSSPSANYSTCSPLSSHWLPRVLPFIQHCCLETGTYSLPFISQSVWHPAYHLPQDFMLRIFQLSGVRCQLPAKSHVTSSPGNKAAASVMSHQFPWVSQQDWALEGPQRLCVFL